MQGKSKVRQFFGIPEGADTRTLIWSLVMLGRLDVYSRTESCRTFTLRVPVRNAGFGVEMVSSGFEIHELDVRYSFMGCAKGFEICIEKALDQIRAHIENSGGTPIVEDLTAGWLT